MKAAFAGARWLGIRCLETLTTHHDIELIGAYTTDSWEPINEAAEVERLGITPLTEDDLRESLIAGEADICFSVLTSHIFTQPEIDGCGLGIVNLHPAPLPFYRGCNSYAHAIDNDEDFYAVSMHYVDAGIDTGPIIARDWLPIEPIDTGKTLYNRAQAAAANMFPRELRRILDYGFMGERIPHTLVQDDSQARYYPRNSIAALRAGFAMEDPERRIRAVTFPPFPGMERAA